MTAAASAKSAPDEERGVVAACERLERAFAGRGERFRPGRGQAGEDGEAECAAHHERGVHDARREAGVARLDVAHRGQEHRVERHSGTEPEQDHAREHVHDEASRPPARARRAAAEEASPSPPPAAA